METRVGVLGIVVEDLASAPIVNDILHQYSDHIIGRMGIPYHEKGINIISLAVDAPVDKINELSGKLGRVSGVSAKAALATK